MRKTFLILCICIMTLALSCSSRTTPVDNEPDVNANSVTSEEVSSADTADTVTSEETTVSPEDAENIEERDFSLVPLKELCEKSFTLGVGLNGSTLENQTLNLPKYMELSKEHFNSCTMTNLMKSCYILDEAGSQANLKAGDQNPALSFATIDPTLEWCKENGMKMRGHTLVWHTQAPEWFFREGYKSTGKYVDKETMLFRMESYIRQLLTHVQEEYPGVIYCWDVVNEAVDPDSAAENSYFMCRTKLNSDPNPWYETIGEDYVEMAFTYARQYADKDVKLFYNDYNTFQTPKINGIYSLCESLKEKGLIDGIGMQGYWSFSYPSDSTLEYAIKKYAKLDLEIHITELSIGVDEETEEQFKKQGKKYGSIFNMLLNLDTANGGPANITNVTLFGLIDHYRDGDTTNTRIFDKDYQPKPAFEKIKETMIKYY